MLTPCGRVCGLGSIRFAACHAMASAPHPVPVPRGVQKRREFTRAVAVVGRGSSALGIGALAQRRPPRLAEGAPARACLRWRWREVLAGVPKIGRW